MAQPTPTSTAPPPGRDAAQALTDAVHRAVLAPSLHTSRPWSLRLHPVDRPRRIDVRADRGRQLTALDPTGRALVQSVGAALFTTRVALAAAGWATSTRRCPDAADPDLLAVVDLVTGPPDGGIAPLVDLLGLRDTDRPRFGPGAADTADIALFRAAALAEDAELVPVGRAALHRLLAAPTAVAGGARPAAVRDGAEATLVVLTTARDDELAWLRAGEALHRVLLEVARAEWVATPFSQAVEDRPTRDELRGVPTGRRWPQSILRIGPAPLAQA
jgi:hypothetical protein